MGRVKRAVKIILVIAASILIFPCIYLVLCSFMSPNEVLRYYGADQQHYFFHFFPDMPTLSSYYQVFLRRPDYLIKFWNSMLFSGTICVGQVFISVLAGFALAKLYIPFKNIVVFFITLMMLMPIQVSLVSNYVIMSEFHLLDSYLAIILPAIFSAFGVFLMYEYFSKMPEELIEAAQLDGANYFKILWRIAVPYAKPAWSAVIVLAFIDAWNMVEQPLIFLQDKNKYPISVFLANNLEQNMSLAFVCGVLALLPPALLYLYFKDELLDGISEATIK